MTEQPNASTQVAEAPEQSRAPKPRGSRLVARVAVFTRYFILAPIIGLAVAAVVMTGVACVDVVKLTTEAVTGHVEISKLVVGFIEVADIFLLAVVLYIMSVGLYELFIDDTLPLPTWLVIHNLEDLKEKLVGVVIVVLAVFFLGRVIESQAPIEVLYLGGGISLVIYALSYFSSRVLEGGHKE
jgi:uncharacterized membrane protein YqhA